jgi:phospholipid/cholesterol/gamma-HCH transport system substrate-binding protein
MEFRVNYTWVGLFVVVLGVAFVTITLWMTSANRKQYDTYLVYMNEAVSGLNVEAPVKFNGVEIGNVAEITLNPHNPQEVRLVLKIVHGTPVTQSTSAKLMAQGITGLTYIGLKAQTPNAPLLTKTPYSPYPIIPSSPSVLVELDTAIRDVTHNLRQISHLFQQTFNKENQVAIGKSLQNITKFTDILAKNSEQFLDSITLTSQQLNTLSQQALPDAMQIMQQLNQILGSIQQFSNELPNNPSILLRGKTGAPLGPGES